VKPPTTWTEFLAVAAKVKAAGYKAILACGSTDAWCTDIGASGVVSSQLLGDTRIGWPNAKPAKPTSPMRTWWRP